MAVVDDQAVMRESIEETLAQAGFEVSAFPGGTAALEAVGERQFDVVITDLKMPEMSGLELLGNLADAAPGVPVVVITAHGTVESAVDAMKRGAFDYITKPFNPDELEVTIGRAVEHRRLVEENEILRSRISDDDAPVMVGADSGLAQVSALIERVAASDVSVLITGESGTGKEVVARRIHGLSSRAEKAFICVNCAALNAGLLESELFGHEKGAFTGAERMRRGRFELAEGGSILLDEVSEIDPHLQAKLLRVLQEKEYERVGSSATRETDVRIIATTNRNLAKEVEEGRFREDLYYRLNVFPIEVPALRERPGDIPGLARYFLRSFAEQSGRGTMKVSDDAMDVLSRYRWPGNVRELMNVMERAFVMGLGEAIEGASIEPWLGCQPKRRGVAGLEAGMTLKEAEEALIKATLERYGGHRQKTADALGISVRTLINRLQQWKAEANVA
ncbi:MAG: sigma-54-dependent transcriptional regulator [Planctomycetota bacterium]